MTPDELRQLPRCVLEAAVKILDEQKGADDDELRRSLPGGN